MNSIDLIEPSRNARQRAVSPYSLYLCLLLKALMLHEPQRLQRRDELSDQFDYQINEDQKMLWS